MDLSGLLLSSRVSLQRKNLFSRKRDVATSLCSKGSLFSERVLLGEEKRGKGSLSRKKDFLSIRVLGEGGGRGSMRSHLGKKGETFSEKKGLSSERGERLSLFLAGVFRRKELSRAPLFSRKKNLSGRGRFAERKRRVSIFLY